MFQGHRRKLIIIGSVLALFLYGITLALRRGRLATEAAKMAMEQEAPKQMELPRLAQEAWIADQKSQQLLRSATEAKTALSGASEIRAGTKEETRSTPILQSKEGTASSCLLPAGVDRLLSSQKVVRTGELSLEVKTFGLAFDRVQEIASGVGGYIANIQMRRPAQGTAQGTITLRVPPANYFQALNLLRPLGRLEKETSSLQDVTRRWLNLDVRIQHKREIEARMWGAVRKGSDDMSRLTEAENNLDDVNLGIEQLESERYDLQQNVLFSTITLELHEPVLVAPIPERPSLWTPLGNALREAAIQVVLDVSRLIYLGLVLLPWALLGGLIWRPACRIIRRAKDFRQERSVDTV